MVENITGSQQRSSVAMRNEPSRIWRTHRNSEGLEKKGICEVKNRLAGRRLIRRPLCRTLSLKSKGKTVAV